MKINPVHKLALFYVEGKSEDEALNHTHWSKTYGYEKDTLIKDLQKLKLIEFGFDIETSLGKLKANDLKEILRKNDLKLSGKKQDLVDRIKEHSSTIDFNSFPSVIVLTNKGLEIKEESTHIHYFHNNFYDLDIFTAEQVSNKNPKLSSKEVIVKYINDQIQKDLDNKRYHSASILSYNLADYFDEIGMVEEELKSITLGMAFMILQELYYISAINLNTQDQYDSSIVGHSFGKVTKYRSLSSKYHVTDEGLQTYIYELLNSIIDDSEIVELITEIILLAIQNEDKKINTLVQQYSRKSKSKPNSKKKELANTISKEADKNAGCGCLLFLSLPVIPLLYFMIEIIV